MTMTMIPTMNRLAQATAFQWLPLRFARTYQLHMLRRLVSFCEKNVPLYRETFRRAGVCAGDIQQLSDLSHFPTVTREEIVASYPDGILSRTPRPGDMVFRTSGTSGLFMQIAYSASANAMLDAVYGRALFATGYRPWHRIGYFWSEQRRRPKRLYERLGLMNKSFLPVDPDPQVQLRKLRRLAPHYIYHFPSSLMMIARIVEAQPVDDLKPRGIICHGELLPRETQLALGRIFRCPIWNQYGAQEFNRIGWDCSFHHGLHLDTDSVYLEILDGDRPVAHGEEGEIVLTGLHNRLMPLIRYRIGDAGRTLPGRCPCGRGLPLFELTEGRLDDVITLPDGSKIGPRVLAPAIEKLRGFSQYRLIERKRDQFEIVLVRNADATEETLPNVLDAARQILGASVQLQAKWVADIPLSRRGKLRKIVSQVASDRAKTP